METEYDDNYDYYDDEKNIIYSDSEYYSDSDDEIYYTSSNQENDIYNCKKRPPVEWKQIKLDKCILEVSNDGRVREYNSLNNSSDGKLLKGTPYKIYTTEISPNIFKNFYVHELVWFAFNGFPPENWEIKHKYEYTKKGKKEYKNRLEYLTLVKKLEIEHIQSR